MPTVPSKVLSVVKDSNVGTVEEDLTDPITSGKRAIIKYFGAAIPGTGVVDLYFGDGSSWDLVRSVAGGTYEFKDINEDFVGDGVKRFKVIRTRQGAGGPLAIKAWFKAIER